MKKFKVAEVFGPTIQGEGPYIGMGSFFIRLGGCDYRCSWCDSLHAVLPEEIAKLPTLTEEEIISQLLEKAGDPMMRTFRPVIVLSGGNPALFDLTSLVWRIRDNLLNPLIQVETQGSIWKDWLNEVDHVVISPKPPSSKMKTDWSVLEDFIERLDVYRTPWSLKVVVFDLEDLEYALKIGDSFVKPGSDLYLSVGTHPWDTSESLLGRLGWLATNLWENLEGQVRDYSIRIHPQMHVLIWGHAKGV